MSAVFKATICASLSLCDVDSLKKLMKKVDKKVVFVLFYVRIFVLYEYTNTNFSIFQEKWKM